MIDVVNKRILILGPPGLGKTNLARYFLSLQPNHIVYDPLAEDYEGFDRYVPEDKYSRQEFERCVMDIVIPQNPKLFIVDEGNRYIESMKPLPEGIRELNDWGRHMGTTWGVIARRPVQLHVDLHEMAQLYFIFRMVGKNDKLWLDGRAAGLGSVVSRLETHQFVVLHNTGDWFIHDPVKDMTGVVK